jgi:hypothetical protein
MGVMAEDRELLFLDMLAVNEVVAVLLRLLAVIPSTHLHHLELT